MAESGKELFARLLASGEHMDRCKEILMGDPYNVPLMDVEGWCCDAVLLKGVIDRSNELLGQAWGGMWRKIKEMALLGSVQHCKMLIEFVQDKKGLPDEMLKVIFEKAVAGEKARGD